MPYPDYFYYNRKPKSLILSDQTINEWKDEKREEALVKLKELMDDGFKIYYWYYNIVFLLTKEFLPILRSRPALHLPPQLNVLRDTITRQIPELTPSNSFVIDELALNALLQKNTLIKPKIADISDLAVYTKGLPNWLRIILINTSMENFILDPDYPELDLPVIKQVLSCPKIKSFSIIEYSKKLNQLQSDHIPDSLALIELALIETEIPVKVMHKLAKRDLKLLHLHKCSQTLNIDFATFSPLASLEVIELEFIKITDKQLELLLDKTSRLWRLLLTDIHDITAIKGGDLSHLKMLCVANTSIEAEAVSQVLLRTPKLIKLNLLGCNLGNYNPAWTINLPYVEELILIKAIISQNYLNLLLSNTNSLEQLNLSHARFEAKKLENIKQPINLSALKHLNLAKSNIAEDYFLFLLENAPKLVTLNLSDVQGIESWSESTRLMIENLKAGVPIHNLYLQPLKEASTFIFKGENKSLDQYMIIEKLCQYLTLTKQHIEDISIIQTGICSFLAKLFNAMMIQDWNVLIKRIGEWDGIEANITPQLKTDLKGLSWLVNHLVYNKEEDNYYLGDNLALFLAKKPKSSILVNPWHAIALKYDEEKTYWYLYDPNHPKGFQKTKDINELQGFIKTALGQVISLLGKAPSVPPLIKNTDIFLLNGGLFPLSYANNRQELWSQLKDKDFSKEAFKGLFLFDCLGKIAWQIALINPSLTAYTIRLLEQYKKKHADYKKKLEDSLLKLIPQDRQEIQDTLTKALSLDKHTRPFVAELLQILSPTLYQMPGVIFAAPLPPINNAQTQISSFPDQEKEKQPNAVAAADTPPKLIALAQNNSNIKSKAVCFFKQKEGDPYGLNAQSYSNLGDLCTAQPPPKQGF